MLRVAAVSSPAMFSKVSILPSVLLCVTLAQHDAACTAKSCDAKFKLLAIEYALENGNQVTGRQFDVSKKHDAGLAQSCRRFRSTKPTKKADRDKIARWRIVCTQQLPQACILVAHSKEGSSVHFTVLTG